MYLGEGYWWSKLEMGSKHFMWGTKENAARLETSLFLAM
jgi:hypothetical protein